MKIRVTVAEIRAEAPDAVTLKLDLGGVPFPHQAGQYVEIDPHQFEHLAGIIAELEKKNGRPEGNRGFSIASDGLQPGFIELSIKENPRQGAYGQLLSPFLVRGLTPGQELFVEGPGGKYCLPETPPPGVTGFLHLCAGSGLAPNRAMIRHALGRGWPQKHLLCVQNRTEADIFYKGEWPDLLARHPQHLRIHHGFSSRGERLDAATVRRMMDGFLDPATSWAFVCGPAKWRGSEPGFVPRWCGDPKKGLEGLLEGLGFAPERVFTER